MFPHCGNETRATWYSQLSPSGHLTITDTLLLQTAAEVPLSKKLLKTTPATTDFLYYGHQILVPMVSAITRGD